MKCLQLFCGGSREARMIVPKLAKRGFNCVLGSDATKKEGEIAGLRALCHGFFFGSVIFVSLTSRSNHAGAGSFVVNSIDFSISFSHVGSS